MDDIIRIIKLLENSGILFDRISKTVKREIKRQESGFLGMLLGILSTSMLANTIARKGAMGAKKGVVRT